MTEIGPNVTGNNIRALRLEKGLTQSQLADRMGVHFTTIAKLERSMRRLSVEWIVKIADALGVDPKALVGWGGAERPEVRSIPLAGKIAAGNWREAIQDPTGWVCTTQGGPNTFALDPDGDSMNKVVPPGAHVVIDPDDFELRDGRYYAVMNDEGETTFKQYRAEPPRLEPCSTNPEHEAILLGRRPFTVIGRVIGQGSSL